MGNTCCGDSKGRKMTLEAILRMQGFARKLQAEAQKSEKLRQWIN